METLDKFFNEDKPDGFYAVWKSGMFYAQQPQRLFGFSGAVVEYSNREGFKDCPEWMDKNPEEEINIVLLEILPPVEMF